MRAHFRVLIVATALWLAACTGARQTKPFPYPGDGRSTVEPIAAAVRKRGFEPVAREREWCKFKYKDRIWIHFKARPDQVVIAVDVADAKNLPKAEVDALFAEGMKVGEEIWREASADATAKEAALAKEKQQEEARRAEEAKRKEEADRQAAAQGNQGSGNTALGVLSAIGSVAGALNGGAPGAGAGAPPAQGSGQQYCCVNSQYYDCPTPSALRKGCGELAACMTGCMNQSSMDCPDRCLKDHPPDTSECKRDTSHDAQCARR